VQAAGRCNRNGELPGLGEVRVFRPPTESPKGFLRWAEQATDKVIQLISRGKLAEDPLNVAVMDTYFSQLSGFFPSMDEKEILKDLDKDSRESYEEEPLNIAFRSAAKKFRLIDDETGYTPVVVQYGQWESKVNDLERLGPSRDRLRALQRFTVTLPQYIHAQLVKDEDIVPLCLPQRPGNSVREASLFKQQNTRLYDADKLGLQIEATHYVV
jgi:CRISPR-associated endonuclease/helicase Cas3